VKSGESQGNQIVPHVDHEKTQQAITAHCEINENALRQDAAQEESATVRAGSRTRSIARSRL
jgi:hypothetical protein